ncbi:MAG TPA: hypothetical protein VFA32_04815 [Dehalococcoidia bacterium]|nr:hypothetical protein [Dehalococcoidia bacterium]
MVVRPGRPDQLTLRDSYQEAVQQGDLKGYWSKRWGRSEEYPAWISDTNLPALSKEQAVALYQASGGRRSAEFKSNNLEEIRYSLDFLLYDTIKLEGRFDECVAEGGSYTLTGAGKEFVSYLLCLREPSLLGTWNASTERALRVLDIYPDTLRKGHWGLRYLDLLEVLQRVRLKLGLGDFREVDLFAYWVARMTRASR